MIARIWHGKTSMENFETYTEFLKQTAIPDYQQTTGFKGLTFLRQTQNNEGHFTLITYWENLEVIKNFAGQNFEKAKYYPQDKNFLLAFEENVQHLEVFATGNSTIDKLTC
ncbi:MAG: antibiotic biosynthesis monooxygenase [Agriterribacter sp.]